MDKKITPLGTDAVLNDKSYDPNRLLDALVARMGLKNDAALARLLEVAAPVVSKIRHQRTPIGASILLRMHEKTNVPVAELRTLMKREGA